MKKQFLTVLFLIGLTSMCGCQNNSNSTDTKIKENRVQDSVLIFKTDTTKFYSFTAIDENGKWQPAIAKKVNYHKIDLKDRSLTFFFQLEGQADWGIRKMHFDSLSIEKTGTSYYYNSKYFDRTFLDTLSSKTIAHVLDDYNYIRFINLKKVENSELQKLKIRKEDLELYQEEKVNISNQNQLEDFEYSDYWRKEAFKTTILFVKQKLKESTPSCVMVSRSTYNANLVRYIGQNGYRIKLYVEFDCNQNYINPSYFWVDAFYLGKNNWDLALIDQKLTH
ncbi:hypothetical protein INR75_08560 [Zunongwangia sp. SCSIO 43204]|uniref:hypothetical protein n=1 Tax=Zunongwangia sp. SCSIO 43204 TaxID=2779359 RepID=UPI001CA87F93|nr:hypothetical protein [Zunongwangia sp. SCSIO 43204]UAB86031.1 hypothetical protein INR75_08560 [Zunongwangia sp. SCSIO 43204]